MHELRVLAPWQKARVRLLTSQENDHYQIDLKSMITALQPPMGAQGDQQLPAFSVIVSPFLPDS